FGQTSGAARVGGHHGRQPLGEDATRTGRLAAEELADTQPELHRLLPPGQVSDGPLVQAVDRFGPGAAHRTGASGRRGDQDGDDLLRSDQHVFEPETVSKWKEVGGECTRAWHHSKSYRQPPGPSPKVRESQ